MAQNLLSDNRASLETSVTPLWSIYSTTTATITRDTSEHFKGVASMKVVTAGASRFEGVLQRFESEPVAAVEGEDITMSGYVKGDGGTINIYVLSLTSGQIHISSIQTQFVTTSEWTRYEATHTMPATNAYVASMFITVTAQPSQTFYIDGMQMERASSATPWRLQSRWGARNLASKTAIEAAMI